MKKVILGILIALNLFVWISQTSFDPVDIPRIYWAEPVYEYCSAEAALDTGLSKIPCEPLCPMINIEPSGFPFVTESNYCGSEINDLAPTLNILFIILLASLTLFYYYWFFVKSHKQK